MTRQCPDHLGRMDALLGSCRHCAAEAAQANHAAKAAAVRAALRNAPRPAIAAEPTTPTHDLAAARAKADREDRR